MTDLTGKTLSNQFFLRQLIGSGGMADVYLAWDNQRATKMAVKVLRRDLAANRKFYKAFEKEKKTSGGTAASQYCSFVRIRTGS